MMELCSDCPPARYSTNKTRCIGCPRREPEKLITLPEVREYGDREPVEIWNNSEGRLIIRAYNEGGNNSTDVDLIDLLEWAKQSPIVTAAEDSGRGPPNDNIVHLSANTTLPIPSERVLTCALEQKIEDVIVIGTAPNGELYLAAAGADAPEILFALERAKMRLMQGR